MNHSKHAWLLLLNLYKTLIGSTYRKGRMDPRFRKNFISKPDTSSIKRWKVNDESHGFTGVFSSLVSPLIKVTLRVRWCLVFKPKNRLTKSGKVSVSVKPTLYNGKWPSKTEFALKTAVLMPNSKRAFIRAWSIERFGLWFRLCWSRAVRWPAFRHGWWWHTVKPRFQWLALRQGLHALHRQAKLCLTDVTRCFASAWGDWSRSITERATDRFPEASSQSKISQPWTQRLAWKSDDIFCGTHLSFLASSNLRMDKEDKFLVKESVLITHSLTLWMCISTACFHCFTCCRSLMAAWWKRVPRVILAGRFYSAPLLGIRSDTECWIDWMKSTKVRAIRGAKNQ